MKCLKCSIVIAAKNPNLMATQNAVGGFRVFCVDFSLLKYHKCFVCVFVVVVVAAFVVCVHFFFFFPFYCSKLFTMNIAAVTVVGEYTNS